MEVALGGVDLDALVAHTPVALAVADQSGCLAFTSPAMQEMLARPFEPLHHTTWVTDYGLCAEDGVTALSPDDVPLARALAGEMVTDAVIAVRPPHRPQVVRYARCNAAPVRDVHDGIVGAVVLVQDVTAEKVALQAETVLRDRLVETVHHHLRTPMTTIVGHVELLRGLHTALPADARHSVTALTSAADELVRLADEITVISELQRSSQLEITHGALSALIRDVVSARRHRHEQDRLEPCLPADDDVALDFPRIEQALTALIDNAFDHGPAGAPVTLAARRERDALVLTVTDTGSGIDPDEWPRLVEPFERGDQRDLHTGRRGLGLAFARTIANAHGGQLTSHVTDPTTAPRHHVALVLPVRD